MSSQEASESPITFRTVAIGITTGAAGSVVGSLAVLQRFGTPFWAALSVLLATLLYTCYACTSTAIYRSLRRPLRREHKRLYGSSRRWGAGGWFCDCGARHRSSP